MDNSTILNISFNKIQSYISNMDSNTQKVVDYKSPVELMGRIDFSIPDSGVSQSEFLEFIDNYLQYSVQTGNKQFFNQLYSGFNFPAFIGEMFTVLANTSMYTYEVAPMATIIERQMIKLMNSYSGYTNGDGIFVSGGSNANLIAMFSARNKLFPDGRFEGIYSQKPLKAFVNEQAHYSFETAANILGIGANNVVKVKADSSGKMSPEELEKEIKKSIANGEQPFFVAATCATTLLGAYDPIDEMSKICKKYNIWLHADGSFGGSVILSDKHRHLMSGIEKADSFAWNPHKLMNIPLVCSVILVKGSSTLYKNITDVNTDYIFHDMDDIEDLGKKSIQCGRRVDAVKLWFAWKYYGINGYQNRIDNQLNMAAYAEDIVNSSSKLEMISSRQSFTVCFRYIPKNYTDLNKFNLELREKLRKSGKTIVNYGYLGKTLTIRLVIANAEVEKEDLNTFFELLLEAGSDLEKQFSALSMQSSAIEKIIFQN